MNSRMFTKADLLQMNNSSLGVNWITNINKIKEDSLAKLYPTWAAGVAGRLYVALPATLNMSNDIKLKYNIIM